MKRILCLVGLLTLLIPAPSLAEPFTLRNGYAWGMTQKEAAALAQSEGLTSGDSNNDQIIVYRDVPLGVEVQ